MVAYSEISRRTLVAGLCFVGAVCSVGWVASVAAGERELLRPPGGQDEGRFIGGCIRCGRCLSACPLDCIQPATLQDSIINARTPHLDFKKGYCNFCMRCADVCPTKALEHFDPDVAMLGVAVVSAQRCVSCEQCVPACEYEALSWSDERMLPIVDEDVCNGCGACEHACPSSSLSYYDGDGDRAIRIVRKEVLP